MRSSKVKAPAGAAVAETFEEELASITEKGKDLKGEQRVFYQSIVERVSNNVQVLADLRQEHTTLRSHLTELAREKTLHQKRQTLEGDLHHNEHEVNLLRMQIDRARNDKEKAVEGQRQLEVILTNFKNCENARHPEEQRIVDMKNRLDRANIKNGETTHLMKIYQRIATLMDQQNMHWTPIVERKRAEITQKQKDIKELELIARDSRYSLSVARGQMTRTETQISASKAKRKSMINTKKEQSIAILNRQQAEAESSNAPVRSGTSAMMTQPSLLRQRQNKAARERSEERYRKATAAFESVRDRFGTNDPAEIQQIFVQSREQTATLQKQIDDLKVVCTALERKSSQLKSSIEEAEYASSKGVGGDRLLAEGNRQLDEKRVVLRQVKREMAACADQQKRVTAGVEHIHDLMSVVVTEEDEERDIATSVRWMREKVTSVKQVIEGEDVDYLSIVNKPAFALAVARTEAGYGEDETQKKAAKRTDMKRPAKDAKLDVTTRVLDRATIKMQATKTVQLANQTKKPQAK